MMESTMPDAYKNNARMRLDEGSAHELLGILLDRKERLFAEKADGLQVKDAISRVARMISELRRTMIEKGWLDE